MAPESSGGSRGGSQGAMDPPFHLACKNRILSNLPEVQQSLPAGNLVLFVQSSYKQSLEHLNLQLQAWYSSYSAGQKSAAFQHKSGQALLKVGGAQKFLRASHAFWPN